MIIEELTPNKIKEEFERLFVSPINGAIPLKKNDYMLQLFLANYYNDISEMSRFINCNTELINEYYNSRIISIKEIVSRVFLNKKGGDKLNDK